MVTRSVVDGVVIAAYGLLDELRAARGYDTAKARLSDALRAFADAEAESVTAEDIKAALRTPGDLDIERLAWAMHNTNATGCESLRIPGRSHRPEHYITEDVPIAETVAVAYQTQSPAAGAALDGWGHSRMSEIPLPARPVVPGDPDIGWGRICPETGIAVSSCEEHAKCPE